MRRDLIFIGSKIALNEPYERYILRTVKLHLEKIDSIRYFEEGDKNLFLHLENLLNEKTKLIIITTKNTFTIVGKLLSTTTGDNQILKNDMLIPSRATKIAPDSYLLEHDGSLINVIQTQEGTTLGKILINDENNNSTIHIFNEDLATSQALLEPLAQMFDVKLELCELCSGWVKINIITKKHSNLSQFIASAKALLHHKVINSENIALYIIDKLSNANKKISFAESCSGGLLSYFFTSQSGASTIFDGSLITYSNTIKANWLAVDENTLNSFGAVSSQTVEEMSEGAMGVSGADFSLAISGIAGPTGEVDGKPVGTVYIAVKTQETTKSLRLNFDGDRNYIQEQSVLMAIKMLLDMDKELFFS